MATITFTDRLVASLRRSAPMGAAPAFGLVVLVLAQAPPAPDARLTAADVAKVTGLAVQQVARGSKPGAGMTLNFADAAGLVLGVNFGTDALYTNAKTQATVSVMGKTQPMPLVHALVPGVGDEAFDSPPGSVQWVLYVRKGHQAFSISTFLARGTTPRLTMDQLIALAKIIVGRL